MLFVSLEFLLFLPIVLVLYFCLEVKHRWKLLLLGSYIFYGYYNPAYILLLLLSTGIDFIAGQRIYEAETRKEKKKWIWLSLASNLGILFFFKYFNFFSREVTDLLSFFNLHYDLPEHHFLLPLGISFYTFQTISYSVDIYRGYLKPERHFGKFALYVCFFPQLVAGPIERAKNLIQQFHFNYAFDYKRVVQGLQLILWGFFKKLVLADNFGLFVNEIYDVSNEYNGWAVILGVFFFSMQVFYDFGGYCDIAVGIARIMGIKLSRNFSNHLYHPSPSKHWQEWHITLTQWFRDYLFFPLINLNRSRWFWYVSLFIVFFITGFWHGAAWTFIIWGSLHGIYLVVDHLSKKKRKVFFDNIGLSQNSLLLWGLGVLAFLPFRLLATLFFRATSVDEAFLLLGRSLEWSGSFLHLGNWGLFLLSISALLVFADVINFQMKNKTIYQYLETKSIWFRWGFYCLLINLILYARVADQTDFVYFDF